MVNPILLATQLLIILCPVIWGEYVEPGPKYKCPIPIQIWPCSCLSNTDLGISMKCEDTSLATLASALTYPIYYKIPFELLHLQRLNTETLHGNLFDNLNVTKLIIEDSPIVTIHPDILFNVKDSLVELELINTKLKEYPDAGLRELSNLVTLKLDGHNIEKLGVISGMQSLKNIRISNGNITEFAKGTFEPLVKLARLDLHGNLLKDIPKDAFKGLKNLEFFEIAYNKFDKLDPMYFNHLIKLTWFNGSHNQFPDFRRGAFARNGFLRVIHMTHNKITKLDASTFRGMRLLVRLYLSDNQINDVGRGAFGSLQRIRTIDLARNNLTIVDYQMFSQLLQLEELLIQENQITQIKSGAFKELAYIVMNMSHNQISTIEKDSFTNCINVTLLDMSHNEIDNFTKGAFDELTYPTVWQLEFNKLRRTADIPLKFMSGIKILNVSHNNLVEISKNTFPKLYELHTLDFSHNNISKIQSAIFANSLFSLRHLDLSYNNMTDLQSSVLSAMPTLLDLNLDHNKLKAIGHSAFSRLSSVRFITVQHNVLKKLFQIPPSLSSLNLAYNEINTLERAWPTMNSLISLDLRSNNLGESLGEGGAFSNLGALHKLIIANNNITQIPINALSDLTTLQYIDMSDNAIDHLPRASLGRLPVIFDLLLSNNKITNIATKAFDGLLQLLHLDLSNNEIKDIPIGAFAGLVSLQRLNLSGNSLQRTENGTHCLFEEKLSLETIDLSHNNFRTIYPNTFPEQRWTTYKVEKIDLSHNNINVITKEILRGTKRVKKLNLSYNKINEIRERVLGNMTMLEILDLSNNQIGFLERDILGPPPGLNELILNNNYIRKFPIELINRAPLKFINLENNRLKSFEPDFTTKIKNGSRILVGGNNIACDCRLIELKRYINDYRPQISNFSTEYYEDLLNFKCSSNTFLVNTTENDLACDYIEDPLAPMIPSYNDIEIRSMRKFGSDLEIKWRVKSKLDISGFKIYTQNENGEEMSQKILLYGDRSTKLQLQIGASRVCIRPRLSRGDKYGRPICQMLDAGVYSNAQALSIRKSIKATSIFEFTLLHVIVMFSYYYVILV